MFISTYSSEDDDGDDDDDEMSPFMKYTLKII